MQIGVMLMSTGVHGIWMKGAEKQRTDLHGLDTALFSSTFPCNPIPFAEGRAQRTREEGTAYIKTDEAKRILWVLMAQAYGEAVTVDLYSEWQRH